MRALWKASQIAVIWCLFATVPILNVILFIPVIWLGIAGVSGLGELVNGFFMPTTSGYLVGAAIVWLSSFVLLLLRAWRLKR